MGHPKFHDKSQASLWLQETTKELVELLEVTASSVVLSLSARGLFPLPGEVIAKIRKYERRGPRSQANWDINPSLAIAVELGQLWGSFEPPLPLL